MTEKNATRVCILLALAVLIGLSTGCAVSTSSRNAGVWVCEFNPDSSMLAAGYGGLSGGFKIRLWNTQSLSSSPVTLSGHTRYIHTLAFTHDGQTLASGAEDGTIRIWDLHDLAAEPQIVSVERDTGGATALAFSPDDQILASGGGDHDVVRLWNVEDLAAAPRLLSGGKYSGKELSFSRDGTLLVAAEHDTIRVWSLADQTRSPEVLYPNAGVIHAMALSPDGFTIAEGGNDQVIRLWDIRDLSTYPSLVYLRGHSGTVYSLDFSPDGASLASASADGTARLWNLRDPRHEGRLLRGHRGTVETVCFSPDGRWLASGGLDGRILFWDLHDLNSDPTVLIPDN